MGSDVAPKLLFKGVAQAAQELGRSYGFVVIGTEPVVNEIKQSFNNNDLESIEFILVSEEVTMDDSPLWVVRHKRNSSIAAGIELLKEKTVSAFVSAGNTGALMAYAKLELNMLPGIDRPALMTNLPTEKGSVVVLDVGANVASRPTHLVQFALMGSAYQKYVNAIEIPRVGLLNIGAEARKGTRKVREAYFALKEYCSLKRDVNRLSIMQFCGNIEGREVFQGVVDVLVTDGFTGNVFLKTCEGVSAFILDHLQRQFPAASKETQYIFKDLDKYLNYAEYPGAVLCGLDEIIVKCHGYSSSQAMLSGIKGAIHLLQTDLVKNMKEYL